MRLGLPNRYVQYGYACWQFIPIYRLLAVSFFRVGVSSSELINWPFVYKKYLTSLTPLKKVEIRSILLPVGV